jgi:hypothetical protein
VPCRNPSGPAHGHVGVNTKTLLQTRIPVRREEGRPLRQHDSHRHWRYLSFLLQRSISDHAWYASSATSSTITKSLALTVAGETWTANRPSGVFGLCIYYCLVWARTLGALQDPTFLAKPPRTVSHILQQDVHLASGPWLNYRKNRGEGLSPLSRSNPGSFFFALETYPGISRDFHLPSQPSRYRQPQGGG